MNFSTQVICGHGPAVHGEFFVPAAGIFLPHKETSSWSASSSNLVNLWCTQGSGATGGWHLPSLPQTNTLIGLNDIFVHLFYNSCNQFSFFSWFVCHYFVLSCSSLMGLTSCPLPNPTPLCTLASVMACRQQTILDNLMHDMLPTCPQTIKTRCTLMLW